MSLIFKTIHGSHLYGLAHDYSDVDIYKVYEGTSLKLLQEVRDGIDTVHGSLDALLSRAYSGSHQSVEALFSRKKVWAPGMEQKWGSFIEGIHIQGEEVFAKYERTIKKFCFGDQKRRKHAIRLHSNLWDLRRGGRFDPTLPPWEVSLVNEMSEKSGQELKELLLGA